MVDFKGLGPTPVARLIAAKSPGLFMAKSGSTHDKNQHASAIAFLSQH
jgi:hypothetical protein